MTLAIINVLYYALTILLTVLLTVLLEPHVSLLVTKFMSRFCRRKERSMTGVWVSEYLYVTKKNQHKLVSHLFVVRQFRNSVIGNTINGEFHKHFIKGRLEMNQYFNGHWYNRTDGDAFLGTMQLFLIPEGNIMVGRWIGFNSNNQIMSNHWSWKLVTRSVRKKSIKDCVSKFRISNEEVKTISQEDAHNWIENNINKYY